MNISDLTPPAIFISHGSPDLPLRPSSARTFLKQLGKRINKPRAVVMMSAHWGARSPLVSMAKQYESSIDFHGFPSELSQLHYSSPGAPQVAQQVLNLLQIAGLNGTPRNRTVLDHGVWQPLMLMYPDGVPLVQLSVQSQLVPRYHYELGQALAPLRDDGVVLMGSGSATHNLRSFGNYPFESSPPDWVEKFDRWLADAIARHDLSALLDYRERAPFAVQNHPTEEHLLPLFFALGAAGEGGQGQMLHSSLTYGVISMAAYSFS